MGCADEWWKASAVPLHSFGCAWGCMERRPAHGCGCAGRNPHSPFGQGVDRGFVLASLSLGLFTPCSSPCRVSLLWFPKLHPPPALQSHVNRARCPQAIGMHPRAVLGLRAFPPMSTTFLCRRLGSDDGGPWPADACAQRLLCGFWWSGYILWVLVGLQVWVARGLSHGTPQCCCSRGAEGQAGRTVRHCTACMPAPTAARF